MGITTRGNELSLTVSAVILHVPSANHILIYNEKTFQAAFFIAKNKEIAEDATQEAFLKSYNKNLK